MVEQGGGRVYVRVRLYKVVVQELYNVILCCHGLEAGADGVVVQQEQERAVAPSRSPCLSLSRLPPPQPSLHQSSHLEQPFLAPTTTHPHHNTHTPCTPSREPTTTTTTTTRHGLLLLLCSPLLRLSSSPPRLDRPRYHHPSRTRRITNRFRCLLPRYRSLPSPLSPRRPLMSTNPLKNNAQQRKPSCQRSHQEIVNSLMQQKTC